MIMEQFGIRISTSMIKVLGIDPSMCRTGWGLINGEDLSHIAHGIIKVKSTLASEQRLASLACELETLIKIHNPSIACIEETFCGINPMTTLRLGFAFGAILTVCGRLNIPVYKYATRLVKQTLADTGAATKDMVLLRVKDMLKVEIDNFDSSDALAVALAHCILKDRNSN
jgi:crossover junction endodeoxyribonuclease RuvC